MTAASRTADGAAPSRSQPGTDKPAKTGLRAKPWWPWARRVLTVAFFALVTWMLVSHARDIEWAKVGGAMKQLPLTTLLIAAAVAMCSHLLYSCFDLFGRAATQHGLPVPRVMALTFVSYVFNLNLGSIVGGIALRYRLYAKLGLDNGTTTRVLGISMFTNWIGYLLLAGGIFAIDPPQLPEGWAIDTPTLRPIGAALALIPVAYLLACAFAKRREWSVRGHAFTLPSVRFAALQIVASSVNWLLIGTTVWVLLQGKVDLPTSIAVLLLGAVAGLLTHVPAGLGVLEAVFIALLSPGVPKDELLGSLLAYRAVYYLIPLAIATLMYLFLEARTGKGADAASG